MRRGVLGFRSEDFYRTHRLHPIARLNDIEWLYLERHPWDILASGKLLFISIFNSSPITGVIDLLYFKLLWKALLFPLKPLSITDLMAGYICFKVRSVKVFLRLFRPRFSKRKCTNGLRRFYGMGHPQLPWGQMLHCGRTIAKPIRL